MNGQVVNLANLAAGLTPEQVVHSYPSLTSEQYRLRRLPGPRLTAWSLTGLRQTAPVGCIAVSGGRAQIASMYT